MQLYYAGKTPKENRGKSKGSRTKAIPGFVCQKIHEHIESFPVKETHYANRNIKYLSADLNVKIMHSLFKEKHCDIQVHYDFYLKVFSQTFYLPFW